MRRPYTRVHSSLCCRGRLNSIEQCLCQVGRYFGTASWIDRHLTEWIQPQKLRAPEVILGAKWNHKVDIWNLGVIVRLILVTLDPYNTNPSQVWELAEGQLLFDGQWTASGEYSAAAHLAQMTAVLGNVSKSLLDRSRSQSRYFDTDGMYTHPLGDA